MTHPHCILDSQSKFLPGPPKVGRTNLALVVLFRGVTVDFDAPLPAGAAGLHAVVKAVTSRRPR